MGKKNRSPEILKKKCNTSGCSIYKILTFTCPIYIAIISFLFTNFNSNEINLYNQGFTIQLDKLETFEDHEIINYHAAMVENLVKIEETFEGTPLDNNFLDKVKAKLRPILGRYSSILKQTKIYEDLVAKKGLTGGPSHFVESSIKELKHLVTLVVQTVDKELTECELKVEANFDLRTDAIRLIVSIDQHYPINKKIQVLSRLATRGIKFHPLLNNIFETNAIADQQLVLDKENMKQVAINLRRVGTIYKDLNEAVEDLMKLRRQWSSLKKNHQLVQSDVDDIQDRLDDSIRRHNSLKDEMLQETTLNGKLYELTYPYKTQMLQKIQQALGDRKDLGKKLKDPYVKLRDDLVGNLLKLEKRVKKLMK